MQIMFNDEKIECEENITITVLLKQLKQLKPSIALALNQQILPREQWDFQQVQNGDKILLFQVIAGG